MYYSVRSLTDIKRPVAARYRGQWWRMLDQSCEWMEGSILRSGYLLANGLFLDAGVFTNEAYQFSHVCTQYRCIKKQWHHKASGIYSFTTFNIVTPHIYNRAHVSSGATGLFNANSSLCSYLEVWHFQRACFCPCVKTLVLSISSSFIYFYAHHHTYSIYNSMPSIIVSFPWHLINIFLEAWCQSPFVVYVGSQTASIAQS